MLSPKGKSVAVWGPSCLQTSSLTGLLLLRSAMGPPEAGTKAYKTYLEKQRDRRRGVRKAGKTASLAKDAGALVSAAVLDTARRWSKDFDEQVRLKNQKR